jgi:hypothetical protein
VSRHAMTMSASLRCLFGPSKRWTDKLRSKLFDFICPLRNNALGYDDESTLFGVSKHRSNQLRTFAKPHFITEETSLRSRCLVLHCKHPQNTFALVGGE